MKAQSQLEQACHLGLTAGCWGSQLLLYSMDRMRGGVDVPQVQCMLSMGRKPRALSPARKITVHGCEGSTGSHERVLVHARHGTGLRQCRDQMYAQPFVF